MPLLPNTDCCVYGIKRGEKWYIREEVYIVGSGTHGKLKCYNGMKKEEKT
jgi:hypothetical protein